MTISECIEALHPNGHLDTGQSVKSDGGMTENQKCFLCCACLSDAGTRKAQGNANLREDANGPPQVVPNDIMVPAVMFT